MKKFEKEFFELLRTPEKDRALLVRRDQALCGLIARFEMQDRDKVLRYAEAGDWTPLADYVRKGGRVTIQMRPFLADVLDGKRKRPAKKNKCSRNGAEKSRPGGLCWECARPRREGYSKTGRGKVWENMA
jgi:hypothetical protein